MNPKKPLGHKAYGSIPHLPGSRRGPADRGITEQQASICLEKPRDKHDVIIVQEKLDGSNCSVAKVNGEIIPLGRAGYRANTSRFKQHHLFHNWVFENYQRFDELLEEGERCCGEWLAQAHGTRYDLPHEPYVIFDLMRGSERSSFWDLFDRLLILGFKLPNTINIGHSQRIDEVMKAMGQGGHGAIDPVEGAVWRVERNGKVDFLAKYVRPDKVDGCYLPEVSGGEPVWNWLP